jgi:hypothetical protein
LKADMFLISGSGRRLTIQPPCPLVAATPDLVQRFFSYFS